MWRSLHPFLPGLTVLSFSLSISNIPDSERKKEKASVYLELGGGNV